MTDENDKSYFEKHTPIYPLPKEILKMKRDETVCQFCGVSYLIHNEIKKLEDRIKELETSLKDYQDVKLREVELKHSNEENKIQIESMEEKILILTQTIASLNNDLKSKEIDLNSFKSKNQELTNENYSLLANSENKKNKIIKYESAIRETIQHFSNLKSDLKVLQINTKENLRWLSLDLLNFKSNTLKSLRQINEDWDSNSKIIESLKTSINKLSEKHSVENETLNSYEKKIQALETLRNELYSKIDALTKESSKYDQLFAECLNYKNRNLQLMQENSDLKGDNQLLISNVENLKKEVNELNYNIKEAEKSLKSMQEYSQQNADINSNKLRHALDEITLLKKQIDEKEALKNEIIEITTREKNLFNEIDFLRNRLNEIEDEKKSLVLTHQCEIIELKDRFKDRLKNNEGLADGLNSELAKQREKYLKQMKEMEESLREGFQCELEISRQKYEDMSRKFESVKMELEHNSKSKLAGLEMEKQRLASELKCLHEEKLEREEKMRLELEKLRSIAKTLHEKLEKYSEDDSQSDILKLKHESIRKDEIIFENEKKIKSLEESVLNQNEQIRVLQEIVHKECLERDELLKNLGATKDELFVLKKNHVSSKITSNFEFKRSGVDDHLNKMKITSRFTSPDDSTNSSRKNSLPMSNKNNSSGKSSAESKSSLMDNSKRLSVNLLASTNIKHATSEPFQLFKKLNEISNHQDHSGRNSLKNSNMENRKRISLLLSKKT